MRQENWRALVGRRSATSVLAALLAATVGATPASGQDCDVHLVLDGPVDGAELSGRPEVRGWALDRRAAAGTGVEAMRVALVHDDDREDTVRWQPLPYGLARPDVALALARQRAADAGFALNWSIAGLAPGEYTLRVEARTTCGWTTLARRVRVVGERAAAAGSQEVLLAAPAPRAPAAGPADAAAPARPAVDPMARPLPVPYAAATPRQRLTLTVTPFGTEGAALSWAPLDGAESYAVYQLDESSVPAAGPVRPPTPQATYQRIQSLAGTSTTVNGLAQGRPYRFLVRALVPNRGEVAESEAVRFLIELPANDLAVTSAAGTVILNWTAVPGAVRYALLGAAGAAAPQPDPARGTLQGTNTLVEVPPGAYAFQIEARDAAGNRLARSNVASVVVENFGAPYGGTSAAGMGPLLPGTFAPAGLTGLPPQARPPLGPGGLQANPATGGAAAIPPLAPVNAQAIPGAPAASGIAGAPPAAPTSASTTPIPPNAAASSAAAPVAR